MKNRTTRRLSVLLLIALNITSLISQTFANFQWYNSYTDNLFQNYSPASDNINTTAFSIYHHTKSNLTLYYNGNLNLFLNYTDLQNHNHYVGINKKQRLGNEHNELFLGCYIQTRIDKPVYDIYDNVKMYAFGSVKYYLFPTLLFRAKNTSGFRSYIHYSDYSYFENVLSVNISKFFQTRTTLQLGMDYFIKDYQKDQTYTVTRPNGQTAGSYIIDSPAVSQFTIFLKLAQNINNLTAVQLQYQYRKTLSGQNRFADVEEYFTDDVLFDDHYSYSGSEVFASIKRFLPFQLVASISGYYQEKMFNDRAVYDLEGIELFSKGDRRDYQSGFTCQVEKHFSGDKIPLLKSVELYANYTWIINHSNDPYYQFSNGLFSTGIGANF